MFVVYFIMFINILEHRSRWSNGAIKDVALFNDVWIAREEKALNIVLNLWIIFTKKGLHTTSTNVFFLKRKLFIVYIAKKSYLSVPKLQLFNLIRYLYFVLHVLYLHLLVCQVHKNLKSHSLGSQVVNFHFKTFYSINTCILLSEQENEIIFSDIRRC